MLRLLDEFFWVLRREGFEISPAAALLAVQAAALVGFEDRNAFQGALLCALVERAQDRRRFIASFDRFFSRGRAHASDFWGRLRDRGFHDAELLALRELLDAASERRGPGEMQGVLAFAGEESELDHLLMRAGIARLLAPMQSPLQVGFYTQRLYEQLGIPKIGGALRRIRQALREALGAERGEALSDALGDELEAMRHRIRAHVSMSLERKLSGNEDADGLKSRVDKPFQVLSQDEIEEVRHAIKTLAERIRGAERMRRRRAQKGRIDPHRTMRKSLQTGGVPFVPIRRAKRRDKPKLMILCDISDSVRHAASFMLEFIAVCHELFKQTRTFVFVSEIAETTKLFEQTNTASALARIAQGDLVNAAHNSNYGRVFKLFEEGFGRDIDRRTTLVILGDGRTNYFPDEAQTVRRLRERAGSLLWLCPEDPSRWGSGDSAMLKYSAASTKVLSARTARELEAAAREVVARRK